MTDARPQAKIALLEDRGIVSVAGEDARKLLQGIITNDMDLLDRQPAMLAGLLSPQGKVLFEFLVLRTPGLWIEPPRNAFLLDTARDRAADLAKRLMLYKLRASVTIENQSDRATIAALWGADSSTLYTMPPASNESMPTHFADPRAPALGLRWIIPRGSHEHVMHSCIDSGRAVAKSAADYHAHRIALGIPEGGRDWDFGDAFPHEADLDLFHGVSFDKGCYVGQEIVARMQHRGTVRKRVVRVSGPGDLPATRPDVKVGEATIGRLGSVAGRQGLALLRLDRAIEALDKGEAISVDGIGLEIDPGMVERQRALMAAKASAP